ncbi:MAG: YwaF family protein [Clostridia bacterium]|nr:YwaF family protein [Clostridia bacterium]
MLQFLYYAILGFIVLSTSTLLFLLIKTKKLTNLDKTLKIFAIVLAFVFAVRYGFFREEIASTVGVLYGSPVLDPFLTIVSLFLTWFTYASVLMLVLYPFFKIKTIQNFIKFFVLPVAVLNIIFFWANLQALAGTAVFDNFNVKALAYAVECGLVLSFALLITIKSGSIKIPKIEVKNLLLSIVPILLSIMPPFFLSVLFGYVGNGLELEGLTPEHRIVLYGSLIVPLVIYFMLRKKDPKLIRFSLLYLSLGMFITFMFNFKLETFLNPANWPLHLCHTAMYIVPICLIFKWEKLFYFTYFINVLGAFLAMVMPNLSDGLNIFAPSMLVFYINHYSAFFMPLLVVALGVFGRPKWKQFVYSMVGFAVYFVFILFINAWFTNFDSGVDFFFVNSDFIADKLGLWAEHLRDITASFQIGDLTFKFYPIYQTLFFLVYVGFAFGMWFIYEQFFSIAKQHKDMAERKKKIKLDGLALAILLNGKEVNEPVNQNGINKLILKNFSKKYGESKIFAVKDANLEVNGGEIFGFLGPNGAGKSTIIKSTVGIQPITSGSIEICGYDCEKQSIMAKKQVGFVPDHYALYEKLTGREYINYIADLYGVSLEDRNKRLNKFLEQFELKQAIDNPIKTYSHGMKQKITIISALIHNPKLWILDEPLTGLDPNSIFQVKECMKEHAKNGNIVFFSSHIIDVVERICDRIAIIKNGKILGVFAIVDLEKQGIKLEEFYLNTIKGND